MRLEDEPCSMFAIDAEALGERALSEAEHRSLAKDPERRRRFEEHRQKQEGFLRRFPRFESLSAAARQRQERRGNSLWRLRFAMVPLAAVATLAVLFAKPGSHSQEGSDRIKGASVSPFEMAVVRGDEARPFTGQAVRQADKLIFRTRAPVDYLSIFSLEASGRVQAIVVAPAQHDKDDRGEKGQSLAVHLPPNAPCPQGVEVDGYPGHERIVAVASAAPLPAERIAEWLRLSYAAMTPADRGVLPLPPPPFAAQVSTWLLEKDTSP
jgi:hypothetical protein